MLGYASLPASGTKRCTFPARSLSPPMPLVDDLVKRRIATLDRYNVMDTPPEQEFDDLTHLAGFICDTPTAVISLLDATRQWFKSRVGLNVPETPLSASFCAHAIKEEGVMVVNDATKDLRFQNYTNVTGDPHIRFYAGAPLISDDGTPVGTICVIDSKPRDLSEAQEKALAALSRQVITQLELRRMMRELAGALVEKEKALKHVRQLQGLLPICSYCKRVRDDRNYWNEVADYFSTHSEMQFSHSICPSCLPRARAELGLPPE